MAKELQAAYVERTKIAKATGDEQPKELSELNARIERLRARLMAGDPDMAADELLAVIDRAEAKRHELTSQQPAARESAKILAMLPKAAETYRRQIVKGLEGDDQEALKARLILRELFGGAIRLVPEPGGGLVAHWNLHAAALLQATGTDGSGGRI